MTALTVIERAVISSASPADLDAILELERTGFEPASQWSGESWTAELSGTDRCVLVVRDGARLAGVATFQVVAEVADLHRVVVAPEQRGRGIGRALIEAGMDWAAEQSAERMLLEVEHDNAPALVLYRRAGFAEIARRGDYYGAGRHALVMQKELIG